MSIVAEAMSTLGLPKDLGMEIREVLIDALLAHPDAQMLLRRSMPDPCVERSDEVELADSETDRRPIPKNVTG